MQENDRLKVSTNPVVESPKLTKILKHIKLPSSLFLLARLWKQNQGQVDSLVKYSSLMEKIYESQPIVYPNTK
jgi:hypothetical protein